MRIDLWAYPTNEDCPKEYREHTMTYIEDIPGSGCLVECGYCVKEFDTGPMTNQTESCPHCGKDVIYGRFDW